MLNHKEMTAHIRKRIKVAGIKAKVSMQTFCGSRAIYVRVPAYEVTFSHDEQRTIRSIGKTNRLTRANKLEIEIERMTDPQEMWLFMD